MKKTREHSSTQRDEEPKFIEISFAECEVMEPIRLAVTNARAARGGAGRMSIGDWRATPRHGPTSTRE